MTLKSVMVQLDPAQLAALDREAQRLDVSRSQLIRDAIDASLSPQLDADLARQYADAYPEPTLGADGWGDLDAWHAAAGADRDTDGRDPW